MKAGHGTGSGHYGSDDPESSHASKENAVKDDLPEWEQLLAAAARLQGILPDATLVGGTAAAIEAGHRRSMDADHVLVGLVGRFDEVLAELEAAAGWETSRLKRPVVIYGRLDGILTTVRNLRRSEPLETETKTVAGHMISVPTREEILRIKAWLVVDRNATRDFLDVAAISVLLGDSEVLDSLAPMDRLYPQADPGAVRQQLMRQLASPQPYDLDSVDLAEYKDLSVEWQDWDAVAEQCNHVATLMAEAVATRRSGWADL
jgi:hypothetical protein